MGTQILEFFIIMKHQDKETMRFKKFSPKVDKKRKLVLTRMYAGIRGTNVFQYTIHKMNALGQINSNWKHLYSFGTDEFKSIEQFKNANTGETSKVYKTAFTSIAGVSEKSNPTMVWKKMLSCVG